MRMNRRNVLIGMGAIVAGGGAALGTGAFSQVEATRDVNLETTGDDEALLGLEVKSDTLKGDNETQLEIDVDNLNEDATTMFDEAIELSNNGETEFDVDIEDSLPAGITMEEDGEESIENGITVGTSDEVLLDVEIDTSDDAWDDQGEETITFVATTDE